MRNVKTGTVATIVFKSIKSFNRHILCVVSERLGVKLSNLVLDFIVITTLKLFEKSLAGFRIKAAGSVVKTGPKEQRISTSIYYISF